MRWVSLIIFGLLVQGCATVTSGTTHSLAVVTDPAGATCQVKRDGQVIGVVNPTPGTVTVSKSVRPLAIDCTRAGGQPGAAVVQPEFQAMTLGNLLLGGVIGLAIDAASGAMGNYPPNVTVVLAPERFNSAAQRDSFYAARSAEIRQSFEERIATVRRNCAPGAPAVCDDQISVLQRDRDEELQKIERLRESAQVL